MRPGGGARGARVPSCVTFGTQRLSDYYPGVSLRFTHPATSSMSLRDAKHILGAALGDRTSFAPSDRSENSEANKINSGWLRDRGYFKKAEAKCELDRA
jgi:hypothetical protein